MTPRSLFAIIIKTIALYLLIISFYAIPAFINSMMYFFQSAGMPNQGISDFVVPSVAAILILGFYVFFFCLCFFKTNWIIDKLRLDRGFDEETFGLDMHRSTVLKIIVTITGALIMADSLPFIFKYLISYFQESKVLYLRSSQNSSTGWLIYYFVKLLIGVFLLTANRMVVNFIELKRKS